MLFPWTLLPPDLTKWKIPYSGSAQVSSHYTTIPSWTSFALNKTYWPRLNLKNERKENTHLTKKNLTKKATPKPHKQPHCHILEGISLNPLCSAFAFNHTCSNVSSLLMWKLLNTYKVKPAHIFLILILPNSPICRHARPCSTWTTALWISPLWEEKMTSKKC